jgi:hypothetical protein
LFPKAHHDRSFLAILSIKLFQGKLIDAVPIDSAVVIRVVSRDCIPLPASSSSSGRRREKRNVKRVSFAVLEKPDERE